MQTDLIMAAVQTERLLRLCLTMHPVPAFLASLHVGVSVGGWIVWTTIDELIIDNC